MKVKIQVTKEDIKASEAERVKFGGDFVKSMGCPIARAASRAFNRPVSVGTEFMDSRILLPVAAQSFIARFDAGAKVRPMEFEV